MSKVLLKLSKTSIQKSEMASMLQCVHSMNYIVKTSECKNIKTISCFGHY